MEQQRRSSDIRLDKIEADVRQLRTDVLENHKLVADIEDKIDVLVEFNQAAKGLKVIGRAIVWVGSIAAAGLVSWKMIKGA